MPAPTSVPADAQLRRLEGWLPRLHEGLRAQLAPSGVTVTELAPPAVATAGQERVNPRALPLDGFLDEVTDLISAEPTP